MCRQRIPKTYARPQGLGLATHEPSSLLIPWSAPYSLHLRSAPLSHISSHQPSSWTGFYIHPCLTAIWSIISSIVSLKEQRTSSYINYIWTNDSDSGASHSLDIFEACHRCRGIKRDPHGPFWILSCPGNFFRSFSFYQVSNCSSASGMHWFWIVRTRILVG